MPPRDLSNRSPANRFERQDEPVDLLADMADNIAEYFAKRWFPILPLSEIEKIMWMIAHTGVIRLLRDGDLVSIEVAGEPYAVCSAAELVAARTDPEPKIWDLTLEGERLMAETGTPALSESTDEPAMEAIAGAYR